MILLRLALVTCLAVSTSGCLTYTVYAATDEETKFKVPYFLLSAAGDAAAGTAVALAQPSGSQGERIAAGVYYTLLVDGLIAAAIALIAKSED